MPKTPVNENDFLPRPEHKVGLAGKIFPVQAEPVAHSVRQPPDIQLGLHILTADRPHIGASVH
jgi:hypothetical protein